jgi:ethanolamine utilization microcompartment shell protein EutS
MAEGFSPVPPGVVGAALLVSDEGQTMYQFNAAMGRLGISLEVCGKSAILKQLLAEHKFEAVIVDLGIGDSASAAIGHVRSSPSNKTAVTFAIVNDHDKVHSAFEDGFRFVVPRPLSEGAIDKILKAAFGLIVRERRRYFRYSVNLPLIVKREDGSPIQCCTVNISEGGLAITTPVPMKQGFRGAAEFSLPNTDLHFNTESQVCWCREDGQAGLRFLTFASGQHAQLQEWLSRRLEENLPEAIVAKFREAASS